MLKEIIEKYGDFHDALISEINYKCHDEYIYPDNRILEVILRCQNFENGEYEIVKLMFKHVRKYSFSEEFSGSSLLIYSALLKKEEDIIIFDFFAIIYGDWLLKENPNSNFIIKCKEVSYEVLSQE